MKIKTFMLPTAEAMDAAVNEFEEHNEVRATQTQHFVSANGTVSFRATVFYKESL